ncbi:peptidoglycan DD-metalloendopeptidase family protein [Vibrio sp. SM6]|uniref:Peptidoglycan DD-metalloendopeptidase family protein n=1 Tax=Vibrio agarilyticus TaxID=2726741 RepID=A0A7X8YHE6_9VIBR|nr:peptidoglycan DD-metalloendopeptidase family protein [Vibrio agarilyticus]NLS14018.1 peptidoglycan DD-metalloendopeptidase family protein [Vibrio agarilyticus]
MASSPQELKGVKAEIARQANALSQQEKQLNQLQTALKTQELDIVKIEKAIRESQTRQRSAQQAVSQLDTQIRELEQDQKRQTEQLKSLLHTYYITRGPNSGGIKLEPNNHDERIGYYFQHLAQLRSDLIASLGQTRQDLAERQALRQQELNQIEVQLRQQTEQRTALKSAQQLRQSTLGNIKKTIKNDQGYLAELKRNESRLKAEIAKAAKRAAVPMDGLAKQKGRLPWPLKGALLHRFGQAQTEHIAWKGTVISATYGDKVNAIYSGTVVFADYLRGYGLVVLLDHGKGDMTLYGFNQAVLKKEGDKVMAGEPIALVGNTGGQDRASLYFEIRRNSHAQNPEHWLTKR